MNKQGKYILVLLLLWQTCTLFAQTTRAEYWMDTDPGHGYATTVMVDANAASVDIPTAALSEGWHVAGLRVQQGRWSQTYTHRFYKTIPYPEKVLSGVEYWMDTDPGLGNADALSFTQGQTVFAIDMPTDSLQPGFHVAGLRVRYDDVWSQTYTHRFFIVEPMPETELTAAEYWMDEDPGQGNALPLSVSARQTELSLDVMQTDTLSDGFHILGLRVRYGEVWSQTYTHRFLHKAKHTEAFQVEAIEAFWDADTTHIASVPFTQEGDSVVIDGYDFPTDTLSYGIHYLYIHAKANGVWSILNRYEICKNAIPAFSFLQDTICAGDELIILDESREVQQETTYEWDVDGNGTTDYTDRGDLLHTFTNAGKYNVTLTVRTGTGCESSFSKEVVVLTKAAPSVTVTRSKSSICAGDSVVYTATPANGGYHPTYTWLRNSVELLTTESNVLVLYDMQDNDTMQVRMNTSNTCADTQVALSGKLVQTVYAVPTIELLFAEVYYTDENAFSLTNMATPAGGKFYINDMEVRLFNPKTNAIGIYTVRYEVSNSNGCKSEAQTTFELKERPTDPTDINNTTDELIPHKILHNGQVFILRGDKIYTITGQEVK